MMPDLVKLDAFHIEIASTCDFVKGSMKPLKALHGEQISTFLGQYSKSH